MSFVNKQVRVVKLIYLANKIKVLLIQFHSFILNLLRFFLLFFNKNRQKVIQQMLKISEKYLKLRSILLF